MSNDFYNTEGYKDSTAYKAIMAIEEAKKRKMKEQAEHDNLYSISSTLLSLRDLSLAAGLNL